jgi:hypothetical protein
MYDVVSGLFTSDVVVCVMIVSHHLTFSRIKTSFSHDFEKDKVVEEHSHHVLKNSIIEHWRIYDEFDIIVTVSELNISARYKQLFEFPRINFVPQN